MLNSSFITGCEQLIHLWTNKKNMAINFYQKLIFQNLKFNTYVNSNLITINNFAKNFEILYKCFLSCC